MFKKWFGIEKLSVKKLCVLAMLTALTVILAVYGTFRVGNIVKIPTKFVTVFLAAALYGPIWGGVVGALGDILNSVLAPVGAPLPQITCVEFVCGFLFGLFFYKKSEKSYLWRTILCALVLTVIDLFVTSAILIDVGIFPNFVAAIGMRAAASAIKCALYVVVCLLLKKHLSSFERIISK